MLWVVAGTGPSLTPDVAELCRDLDIIAVNDAYKLLPFARCLYAADMEWWKARDGGPDFAGEKWTVDLAHYDNRAQVKQYNLKTIAAQRGAGFCLKPGAIHLGGNSGFQAVNLAITFGATFIIMIGFDMKGSHFFGQYEKPLRQKWNYAGWIDKFEEAARLLPDHIQIINATPESALTVFPVMSLEEAIKCCAPGGSTARFPSNAKPIPATTTANPSQPGPASGRPGGHNIRL